MSQAKFNFKFIEKKSLWFTVSILVILIGFGLMVNRMFKEAPALNYGIDFVGGSSIMLKFDHLNKNPQTDTIQFIAKVRQSLKDIGQEKSHIQITQYKEVIIKTNSLNKDAIDDIQAQLRNKFGAIEILEIDFIGPSIGQELREKSIWIISIVSLCLLLYISWRFEFSFGIAALIALVHDTLVTLSLASILELEINSAFVAAVLTILGYSINDTIVVFDRMRENLRSKKLAANSLESIANLSLNQTLLRSINTSVTTIIVITCLMLFGGSTIKEFCQVLLCGILAGTYSSIFIASPALVNLLNKKQSS